jgi:hypothetical protein
MCRAIDAGIAWTAVFAIAASIPDSFMIPVKAAAARRMAAIINAAVACALTRSRCRSDDG